MPASTDRCSLELHLGEAGGAARLVVRGEFDMAPVEAFEAHMDRLSEQGTPVVVDLSGLTFLDSCATCSLVRAAWRGPDVRMVAPDGAAWTVLELCSLERELPWVAAG